MIGLRVEPPTRNHREHHDGGTSHHDFLEFVGVHTQLLKPIFRQRGG